MMQHLKKYISEEYSCKKDKLKKRCKERESSLWYKQNSRTPRHHEKYAELPLLRDQELGGRGPWEVVGLFCLRARALGLVVSVCICV